MKGKTTIEFMGVDKNAIEFHGHLKTPHTRKSKIVYAFEHITGMRVNECIEFNYKAVNFYYKEPYSFYFTKEKPAWEKDRKPSRRLFRLFQILLAFLKKICLKIKGKLN